MDIIDLLNDFKFDSSGNPIRSSTGSEDADFNKLVDDVYGLLKKNRRLTAKDVIVDTIRNINYNKDSLALPDRDFTGYTFFTRPKLNLQTGNVKASRLLSFLNTSDPNSVAFAIRCLLDPTLADSKEYSEIVNKSLMFDSRNPFIPVLTNRLKNISGFPDLVMETETTEGGFYSEDQTLAKGWDQLNKSYDLSCTFSDVRGGMILAMFFAWFVWMDLALKGPVLAYQKYIDERRICYTVSIYRFLMDETNTYITKWAKATGTFPISIPLGAYFNYDMTNPYVFEGMNLTIPFKVAGRVEYLDPIILQEFNMLVKRYCSGIDSSSMVPFTKDQIDETQASVIPYVDLKTGYNQLYWMGNKSDLSSSIL